MPRHKHIGDTVKSRAFPGISQSPQFRPSPTRVQASPRVEEATTRAGALTATFLKQACRRQKRKLGTRRSEHDRGGGRKRPNAQTPPMRQVIPRSVHPAPPATCLWPKRCLKPGTRPPSHRLSRVMPARIYLVKESVAPVWHAHSPACNPPKDSGRSRRWPCPLPQLRDRWWPLGIEDHPISWTRFNQPP